MHGKLETHALGDILQVLTALRRTGQLVLERPAPHLTASVYFANGKIVHALCPPLTGEDCVHALFAWKSGRFLFLENAGSDRSSIVIDQLALLLESLRRHDEYETILSQLPPLDTILHRQYDSHLTSEVTLSLNQWKLLTHIDGQRSVEDLLHTGWTDPVGTARTLFELIDSGLAITHENIEFLARIVIAPASTEADAPALPSGHLDRELLDHADGRRSLDDLQLLLQCDGHEMIETIRRLFHRRSIEVIVGHEEFHRFVA